MTKALRDAVKPFLYVVIIGCLVTFSVMVYRTLKSAGNRGPAQTPLSSSNAPAKQAVLPQAETNSTFIAAREEGRPRTPQMGRVMAYGGAAFLSLVGLSLLIARDASRFFANRVDDFIFNDDLKGVQDPEYEEAEKVWANGQYLEAIQLMRDYLKRHPREQYVALRIAEIYETNLGNYLAAALEYEEVLKKKLPPERWGWAAIHLANLYSGKLNKVEQATTLLHRIVDEYGQTGAARKARERLGLPEPVGPIDGKQPPARLETQEASEPPIPQSNLPPGFRPK
jgi:TolA-binding protein